ACSGRGGGGPASVGGGDLVGGWADRVVRGRGNFGSPRGPPPLLEEYLAADFVLALYSPRLGEPQPDWPPQTVLTGFAQYDDFDGEHRLPEDLEKFLGDGPPPIVFTLGSDVLTAPPDTFYADSVVAAKLLGRRAVLLGFPLPPGRIGESEVYCQSHASFSAVFPRAAAVVHHGGIGTTAIALKAGKPMLIVPGSFAQPDTAARLVRLGV